MISTRLLFEYRIAAPEFGKGGEVNTGAAIGRIWLTIAAVWRETFVGRDKGLACASHTGALIGRGIQYAEKSWRM